MAIDLALSSALSGLLTSQKALDVISNNISNVNNPDYTRKVLTEENRVVGGVGAGVQVGSITRTVDEGLNSSVRVASGVLNQLQTVDQFNTQLQNLFGQPGDDSSISHLVQNLSDALQTLASSPDQPPSGAVQAAATLTGSLQSVSGKIQDLRVQADQQIGQAVVAINTSLQNIATLNSQIAVNSVAGISTDDLKDQRDKELSTLATYMNFTSFPRPDGTLSIYTSQGTPLLDGQAQTVSHPASSAIQAQMTYDPSTGSGALQGITVNGIDISNQISSGKIASLFQMRDGTLTNLQTQIDTLASTVQTTLNQINNSGTSWPNGGQSLTGTRTFIDPSQQKMSITGGDTSVVLLNSDGTEQARTTVATLMGQYLQANGLPTRGSFTVNQLSSAMNGWLNQQFQTSGITYASVTSDGHFSLQLPQTSSTTIAFRDQHTASFESSITSDNLTSAGGGQSLGFTGPLTFRDSAGNVYSTKVVASDTLQDIANKINSLGGLTASLVPVGSNYQLQVTNNAGNDMYADPDAPGATAVSGLGLNPSRSQPSANVSINYASDGLGTNFTSTTYANAATVPGLSGQLNFRDLNGSVAQVTVNAGDSLQTIANNINSAGGGKLNASIVTVGNQVALNVTDASGNQMSIDSPTNLQNALGLTPPPDQVVSGFSNFLGLNDLLVTNQPNVAFDSKTLTNGFATAGTSNLELSDASWKNGDPTTGAQQSLNISFASGLSLSAIAKQINSQAVTYDGTHLPIGSFKAGASSSLTLSTDSGSLGSITVNPGDTLQTIAANINANVALSNSGVRAMVGTDGTNEWLRVYDQKGTPLRFNGDLLGTQSGQFDMTTNQMVTATVVNDGSGQRLRIAHTANSELQVTGSLTSQAAIAASPTGMAQSLGVRADILANPSLMSRGAVQYNAVQNQFYAGTTDNTAVQQMATALTAPLTLASAGGLGQGTYSLTQYASDIISTSANNTASNRTQLTYQQTLVNNLTVQKGSVSGVNLDEELSSLMSYQQSYSASAKVISTIQQLFDVLDNLVH